VRSNLAFARSGDCVTITPTTSAKWIFNIEVASGPPISASLVSSSSTLVLGCAYTDVAAARRMAGRRIRLFIGEP